MTIVLKDNGKRSLEFDENRLKGFLSKRTNITDERFINRLCVTIANKESIKAEEITQLIIDVGLENVDIDQPEWSNEVAKVYLRKLYKEASRNRSYGADESYGSYYGLLKKLGGEGIYNSDILKKYSKEEIEAASKLIKPENDLLFDYTGLYLLSTRYLARGYGKETFELPQERFLTIAMTLMQDEPKETRMKNVGEAYWAMSNLLMTVATPTLTNAGKVGGQLSSCFPPETFIATEDGDKKIKDIVVGDKVLTHDGTYKKVEDVFENYESEKLYGLTFKGKPKELRATGNHPVLAVTNQKDARNIDSLTEGVTSNVHWVKVEDLTTKDYVVIGKLKELLKDNQVFSVSKFTDYNVCLGHDNKLYGLKSGESKKSLKRHEENGVISKQVNSVVDEVEMGFDFGKFIGLFLAEGHLGKSNGKVSSIVFTLNSKNKEDLLFIEEFFTSLGLNSNKKENEDGSTNIIVNSTIFSSALNNYIGTGFDNKSLPSNILDNSEEFLQGILEGVFLGDGTTTRYGVKLQLTNTKLIEQINTIANNLGIFPSHREVITASGKVAGVLDLFIKNKKEEEFSYAVTKKKEVIDEISKKSYKNQHTISSVDGYVLRKVGVIKEYQFDNKVYNLEVEENHSYVAEGVVVHNCFIDTVDDSLDGIYNTNTDIATLSKYGGGIGKQ